MATSTYLNAEKRSLPIALAHRMSMTKPGEQERLRLYNAIFCRMNCADQMRMRVELLEVFEAKRGNRPAQVLNPNN